MAPPADRDRAFPLGPLLAGTLLAALAATVLPLVWVGSSSLENALLRDELANLGSLNRGWGARLDEQLSAAERNVTRLAKVLSGDTPPPRPEDGARFDALVHRTDDGCLRSRTSTYVGLQASALWIPPYVDLDADLTAFLLHAKRVVDDIGVHLPPHIANTWVLPAEGSEVVYWPQRPDFVQVAGPELDYRDTQWVRLTRPEHNPRGVPRWTSASYDTTSSLWMISVVAPYTRNGAWAGAVGHDLLLDGLAATLQDITVHEGTGFHLCRADGTVLVSSRYRADIEDSEGSFRLGDTGDPLLAGGLQGRRSGDGRTVLVDPLPRLDWRLVSVVPHAAVLAEAREAYRSLWWLILIGVLLVLTLPLLVVWRTVVPAVRRLLDGTQRVREGELEHTFERRGSREFREIAAALDGMVARIRDSIDEQQRANLALQLSEERTRAVLQTVADGVLTVDDDDRVHSCNAAAEEMFGWPAERIVGADVAALGPAFEQGWRSGSRSGVQGRRLDGSTFPLAYELHTFRTDHETLCTVTVRDLTEQRQHEERRAALESQLFQAQKMEAIGLLAGGLAHDFNNLLTVIHGFATHIETEQPEGSPTHRSATQILRAADRAATMTRQLLMFARRHETHPERLDLNATVTGLTRLLQRLIREDIELVLDPAPDLPPVYADPHLIEQVIANLVVNANDAMPEGGRLVLATRHQHIPPDGGGGSAPPGDWVALVVIDNGHGIEPSVAPRIFDPFFTTKESGKGTGLGLSTAYSIVQQAGGSITVDSEPGRGTTLTVLLPPSEGPVGAPPAEHRRPPTGGSETIMLVEDEAPLRELMRHTLADLGYRVLAATDGQDALGVALRTRRGIDMLVTDVVMPGLTGNQVAEAVQRDHPDVAVLFVSGYPGELLEDLHLHPAQRAFLAKPFGQNEFARLVRSLLDARRNANAD